MTTRAALWIATRELRGGLAGFHVFLICLVLGVAAIAGVGTMRKAIETGLTDEASVILGGDAELQFTYRFADAAERDWMAGAAEQVSEIVDFRSMIARPRAGGDADRALVQVKAVDSLYPLYGSVELSNGMSLDEALSAADGTPGLVAEKALVDRLGLIIGDRLTLGTSEFQLRGQIDLEPDAAAGGFGLGPRVIVLLNDLTDSGLLSEGSLFSSSYRLRLAPDADLDALRVDARELFADTGLQWRDRRNGTPGISRFVDRLGAFLVLLGLAGLAVGGVGVSSAVSSYLDGKTETIATLKTLGADGGTIFAIYLIQIAVLALAGIALGLVLGVGVPVLAGPYIADRLPIPVEFAVYAAPVLEAALYGSLTALIFSVWPLALARDVRAASLYRHETGGSRQRPRLSYILLTMLLTALLIASATMLSGATRLALFTCGGILLSLLFLMLAAQGLRRLARRAARGGAVRGRPAVRWAFAALGGPGGETASVVLSLGLGLTVLAAIGQIDSNLRGLIRSDLPDRAPAYFVVDIQSGQLDGFMEITDGQTGVEKVETAPMLRGIITRINGTPAREAIGSHWALQGDRGVTYSATPPADAEITEGSWWPDDYSGPPLMSFAAEEAAEMGLKIGDTITLNVLGRDLTAEIANFREVRFENMGINFLMSVNPAALAGAPHTLIATVYADEEAETPLIRDLAEAFPNITAIRVRDAIDRVSSALSGIASATRWGASAALLTGGFVLIGAAAAGQKRRVFEAAILKTLGARRGLILSSFALRSAIVGMAAGLVALGVGTLAGWWVTTSVMDASYRFDAVSALSIVSGGAVASLLAGLAFSLRPLAVRPAHVLRAQE